MLATYKNKRIKRSTEDYIIDFVVAIIVCFVFFVTVYPFWYCIVLSFNEGTDALRGVYIFGPENLLGKL